MISPRCRPTAEWYPAPTAEERWGGNASPRVRSHVTPLTCSGLISGGISAETLAMLQTPEHSGEAQAALGKAKRATFFSYSNSQGSA